MHIGTKRIAKYTVRLSSPRITSDNTDFNGETLYIRQTSSSLYKKKKLKYIIATVTTGVTIAILTAVAVLIPSVIQSNKTTTQTDVSTAGSNISLSLTPNVVTTTFIATSSSSMVLTFTTETTTTTTFSPTCAFRWYPNATTVAGVPGFSSATDEYLGLIIGLFFDSPNTLYVSDGSNHRIQKFLLGNITGQRVAGTGSSGSALNQLSSPRSIAIDRSTNNIYDSDRGNNRIQKFKCY